MRDRASVGGLRYCSYCCEYLSMPNLLHSPPKPQLSLPSEKLVVLLCAEIKRYIGFAWTPPAHRQSDYFPHLGGHHPVCLVGVGTPLYTSTLRHGIYYLPRSNFTVAVSTKSQKKNTHPTAARQPCRHNSGYTAPISGHPSMVLLTAHCTMYSLGLDCWPCGSGYVHQGHASMPCSLLELEQIDVETMQKLYRRFLWMSKKE